MSRSHHVIAVDDELIWVVPAPELRVASAQAASAAALARLTAGLEMEAEAAERSELQDAIIAAAVRVVAGYLDGQLPDLPLIGEPFGGEEGTD